MQHCVCFMKVPVMHHSLDHELAEVHQVVVANWQYAPGVLWFPFGVCKSMVHKVYLNNRIL